MKTVDDARVRRRMAVAGSTLPLPAVDRDGTPTVDQSPEAWRRSLMQIRQCGFRHLDLCDAWLSPAALPPDRLQRLKSVIADCELEVAGYSAVRCSVIDPDHGPENVDRLIRAVDAAAVLGAPVVSIGFHRPLTPAQLRGPFWMVSAPTDERDEANWATAIERVRGVADHAAAHGIGLSLEMHEGTLIGSASGVLRILDGVDRPNLGVNPDLGNLIRVPYPLPEPWRDVFAACVGRMNYWHVKNYIRMEDPQREIALSAPSMLDAGEVDYRWALALAKEAGFQGAICVEHYSGDALWAMEQGRRYLDALLDRMEHSV